MEVLVASCKVDMYVSVMTVSVAKTAKNVSYYKHSGFNKMYGIMDQRYLGARGSHFGSFYGRRDQFVRFGIGITVLAS